MVHGVSRQNDRLPWLYRMLESGSGKPEDPPGPNAVGIVHVRAVVRAGIGVGADRWVRELPVGEDLAVEVNRGIAVVVNLQEPAIRVEVGRAQARWKPILADEQRY